MAYQLHRGLRAVEVQGVDPFLCPQDQMLVWGRDNKHRQVRQKFDKVAKWRIFCARLSVIQPLEVGFSQVVEQFILRGQPWKIFLK